MGNFLRSSLLLLFLLLPYAGSSADVPARLLHAEEEMCTSSTISKDNFNPVLSLHRTSEVVFAFGGDFPYPPSKNNADGLPRGTALFEQRIQDSISQYLLHSRSIHLGLTVGDIIFPFHSFL